MSMLTELFVASAARSIMPMRAAGDMPPGAVPAQAPSPSGWSPTTDIAPSGKLAIDALLGGSKWGGGKGSGVVLDYSFPSYGASWVAAYANDEPAQGFRPLWAGQQAAVKQALQLWSDVANVKFVQVADTAAQVGDLRFGMSSVATTAHSYLPGAFPEAGDVWLSPGVFANASFAPGTYAFQTLLHEVGHALGLKHPHEAEGAFPASVKDWLGSTVMSYRSFVGDDPYSSGYTNDFYPTTPMLEDIQALQYLYGANYATRSGDNVYRWGNGQKLYQCIWDGGGRDLIDCSNQTGAVTISLVAGTWSKIGPAYTWDRGAYTDTVAIAYNVTIENANGGSGNDTLAGNAAANILRGNAGNDTLSGGLGNDTLSGGLGNDSLAGGIGGDTLQGEAGRDTLAGNAGVDVLAGGIGPDTFVFDDGDSGAGAGFRDRITDWSKVEDVLDLRPVDANVTLAGDQAFSFIGKAGFSGVGQLRWYVAGTDTIVQLNTDKDLVAEIEIEVKAFTGGFAFDDFRF